MFNNKKAIFTEAQKRGVFFILFGLLICIFRSALLGWMMTAIGALLVLYGVLKFFDGEVVEAIIAAALGVLVIVGGWLFVGVLLLVLGVALVLLGVADLIHAADKKNTGALVAAIVTLFVGIMLIVSKWVLLDWVFIVVGVSLAVDGALLLVGRRAQ